MIEINLNTARFKLTVKGHAEPDESDSYQQICAATSAIVQALAYSITKFNHEGDALKEFKFRDDPGNAELRVWPEEWAENSIKRRFNEYGDGLELLALSHNCSVSMIWDGEKIIQNGEDEKE